MQTFDIIPWDDSFNTGLALVDEQHQELVKLLNKVASDVAYQRGEIELTELFAGLLAYADLHFNDEEQIWQRYFTTGSEAVDHQGEHARFFEAVHELVASAEHKPTRAVAEEALAFLTQWLVAHILGSDRHLAYAVRAMRAGSSKQQAFTKAAEQMSRFHARTAKIVMTAYGHLSKNTLALMRELGHRQALIEDLEATRASLQAANRQLEATQTQISRERARLQAVLDALPDLVWLQAENGELLASNTGYASLMLEGSDQAPPASETDNEPLKRSSQALGEHFANMRAAPAANDGHIWESFETEGEPADARRQFEIARSPIFDDAGVRIGQLGVAHDVTAHRQLTRRIAAERDLTQRYLDTVQVIIVSMNVDGIITMINRKGCEMLGRSAEELIGQNWFKTCLPQPEGMAQIYPYFVKLMSGDVAAVEFVENEILTASGERRLIAWHNALVRDPEGNITSSLSTGEDVTEPRMLSRALEDEHRRLTNIIAATDVGTWEWNCQTNEVRHNEPWAAMIGFTLEELGQYTASFWTDRAHPDDLKVGGDTLARHLADEREVYAFEARLQHRDGHWVWVGIRGKIVERDATGAPLWLFGTQSDITAQKAAAARLEQAANVFAYAHEGILICDEHKRIMDVNRAFTEITGYEADEVIGQTPRLLASGRHDAAFFAAMWRQIVADGHWAGEIWNRRKGGQVFAERLTISSIRLPSGEVSGYVGLFSDVTELKHHQSQLEHLAHFDVLTNLPNRVLLADRLQLAIARARRSKTTVAVAYLDLDGFKAVNDEHGHAVGDQVLMEVSARMRAALRDCDTLSRMGGDEFVVVLPDLPGPTASRVVINRLLDAATAQIAIKEHAVQVTASIGLTFWHNESDLGPDQLIRQADQAMYQVKQSGKNGFHIFDAAHDRHVRGHHEELLRIEQALRDGEFRLYYQPKVHMRTGAVLGMEALIRWQHPVQGLLSPARFLPAVEGHRLESAIGDWVIDTAMAQMDAWRKAGRPVAVSVNIAGHHLQRTDFADALATTLMRYPDVPPEDLELEILETSALGDTVQVAGVLRRCRELGVACALDDFGTGHSSLTYLRRLPAELIKIDQSFVRDMLEDPDDLAILDGVLGLAAAFRRDVIAEGVEELAQGVMLLRMGCELGQGYAIARPMPAAEVPAWITSWRPPEAWATCARINARHHPLLIGTVAHRGWVKAVLAHLAGEGASSSHLHDARCSLNGQFAEVADGDAPLDAMWASHQALHDCGLALLAKAGSADLDAAEAELLEHLHVFLAATEAILRASTRGSSGSS